MNRRTNSCSDCGTTSKVRPFFTGGPILCRDCRDDRCQEIETRYGKALQELKK